MSGNHLCFRRRAGYRCFCWKAMYVSDWCANRCGNRVKRGDCIVRYYNDNQSDYRWGHSECEPPCADPAPPRDAPVVGPRNIYKDYKYFWTEADKKNNPAVVTPTKTPVRTRPLWRRHSVVTNLDADVLNSNK